MNSLPDVIVVRIFSYLSSDELCLACKLTCSRWYTLSQETALWKNVKVRSHFSDARVLLLAQLMHDSVEVLDCGECEFLTEGGLKAIFELGLSRLRHIALPRTGPFDISLYESLSRSAPLLQIIDNVESGEIFTSSSLFLLSVFPNLESITDKPTSSYGRVRNLIPHWDNLKRSRWEADVKILSANCPNVKKYKCFKGIGYLDQTGIRLIVESFPKLTSLELHSCSIDSGFISSLVSIKGIDRLESLLLEDAGQLTDEGVEHLATYLPNLKQVKFGHCPCLTDNCIQKLSASCPNLREIYINNSASRSDSNGSTRSDLTDTSLQHIANGCHMLNYFRLLYSRAITADGVSALFAQCRNLTYVMLFDCPKVDDDCVPAVCSLPFVRSLVLIGCDSVSSQGMLQLALNPPPYLTRLTFFTSTKSFHGDMAPLVEFVCNNLDIGEFEYRPNGLRHLTVRGVSGAFLQLFCSLCPHLTDLDIRSGLAFGASNLAAIVKSCRALSQLDIAALTCVDDDVLRCIGENSLCLETLHLGSAVDCLSTTSLIELAACSPMLHTLAMDNSSRAIDEELLLAGVRNSRDGGHCVLTVDANASAFSEDDRPIELHMVALKYLLSVPEVVVMDEVKEVAASFALPEADINNSASEVSEE